MRDKQVDLLRFIGLLSLITAHIEPPGWLFQLRNYNVPLLVMASAMVMSHVGLREDYVQYVWKRVKRLAFPVWIFLTFYFFFLALTGLDPAKLTVRHIWNNYTLSNAGGFMWIIRVFLLVACVAPFIYQVDQKVRSNKVYLGFLAAAFGVHEGLIYFFDLSAHSVWIAYAEEYVSYALGYGLLFALGLRLLKLTVLEKWIVGLASFVVFAVLCVVHYVEEGRFVQTQLYKYPPSAYYVSYSIAAVLVTWWCSKFICDLLSKLAWMEEAVMFCARNSLWIYFWHTIFLLVTYRMHGYGFLSKFFVVFVLSAVTVFIQVTIVQKWVLPRIPTEAARKDIKGLLTG